MRTLNKGFTLIELMVTLAVAAIVLGMAIPSFNAQIQNNQAQATAESFIDALNYARSEAVKRVRRVSLCASADGASCGGDWKDGYIVFVDAVTSDDISPPDTSLGVLKAWGAQKSNATLTVAFDDASAATFIRFTSLGALAKTTPAPSKIQADINFDGCTGTNAPRVTVGITGMVSMQMQSCN